MSSQPCCVNCGLYVMHGDCLCDDCRPKVKDPAARIAELEAENADLRGLLLVIGSSHPHLVPHIDDYLKARAEEGSE